MTALAPTFIFCLPRASPSLPTERTEESASLESFELLKCSRASRVAVPEGPAPEVKNGIASGLRPGRGAGWTTEEAACMAAQLPQRAGADPRCRPQTGEGAREVLLHQHTHRENRSLVDAWPGVGAGVEWWWTPGLE